MRSARTRARPVYVTLWFDTEDYILPQDDDATKRLAELLTRLGVRATFKIVGEKARVLESRGRTDVIAAIGKHDIGYHSNTHSQQPTVAVYLQNAGWDEGRAEFYRREVQGVRDVARIFGVTPVTYGQPGSAWAPQAYPALRDLGIRMYLDEADHVGIDDQPFYYGGMLNVFKMRSNLTRMDLSGGASLDKGKAAFTSVYERLRASGGGTISIYYHPNEFVQTEFWDAVNFRRGANPDRADWKQPGTRPAAETEAAFRDFEQYIRFIKEQPGVRFATATELKTLYRMRHRAGRSLPRTCRRSRVPCRRRSHFRSSTGMRSHRLTSSACSPMRWLDTSRARRCRQVTKIAALDGPVRAFRPSTGGSRSSSFRWSAFAGAVRDTAAFCRTEHRVPDEVWVGSENLSPADYLATLAAALDAVIASGKTPTEVARVEGHYTADRYVADDSAALWSWPIFPEGFHAPALMELARLQAWTLKPAVLKP